jgi:predicted dehydrogenase
VTRVAVIGAGIMGSNHARILQTTPDAEIVAIVDPDPLKAQALAKAYGAPGFSDAAGDADVRAVAAIADAVVVATPSHTHADVGVAFLRAGLDVLVEKPIASTVEHARRLVEAAEANDRILAIGHVERFNPAVLELNRLVVDPIHIELTRMGPFSPRITSDVVLDLMIHDLDLACSLAGSEVAAVQAMGRVVRTSELDVVTALLRFENGVTATVTASRIGQTKVRQIELTQRANYVLVDLVRQDVTIHRVDHSEFTSEVGTRYRQSGLVEIPFLENRGEPLALELADFLAAVRTRTPPRVSGTQGLRALQLAIHVRDLATAGS